MNSSDGSPGNRAIGRRLALPVALLALFLLLIGLSPIQAAGPGIVCWDGSIISTGACPLAPTVSIDTTIDATFTRIWHWGIQLDGDQAYAGYTGDDWDHAFSLTVDKQYFVDSWTVEGSIVIENPSAYNANITSVINRLDSIGVTPVDCGVTFPHTLPAGQDLTCTFSVAVETGATISNIALVYTQGVPSSNSDTSNVTFPGAPTVVNDSITVDALGDTYPFNDDGGDILPAQNFACPFDDGAQTTATATINETGQSDSATVSVVCGDDTVALLTIKNITFSAGGLDFEYSFAPTLVDSWTTADGPADLIQPAGVAVDGAGNVYVSGYDNRVVIYDNDGNFIDQFGGPGDGDGQFDGPLSIAVDKLGYIYVVDSNNNRVQRFNSSGNHLQTFGSAGAGAGQLSLPIGLADSPSGLIYVADTFNNRIVIFTPNGNFVAAWGHNVKTGGGTGFEICAVGDTCQAGAAGNGDGQFTTPYGVAVDGDGNVYVADSGNGRIQKFSKNGEYLTQWAFSGVTLIHADARGNVYAADSLGNRVHKFGSEGYFVTALDAPAEFNEPGNIAVDADNNLFIADVSNARVQKYRQTAFVLDDGQSAAFTLEAGEYEISVIVPPGWFWFEIDCDGADEWDYIGHAITVTTDGPPDQIICTFINISEEPAADLDGVDDDIEDGAPNGGDGNSDGIPDSQQNNVASLIAASGYVTIDATNSPGAVINAGFLPTNTIPDELSDSLILLHGLITTGIDLPKVEAQSIEVSLFFEEDEFFDTYYKYGPTPDDPTDHWYEFLYDGQTGAQLLSDRVVLHFVDGERGDSDLTINGEINDPGGPVEITTAELTIIKQVTGDTPDNWSFDFTGDLNGFSLTNDDTDFSATNLTPGDFDLTETNPPGWVTTSSCYPGGETGNESISVNLEGGESGTCYFLNEICLMGTYDDGSACVDAAAGHYTDVSGAAEDIPCAPGSYQPSAGQPGCFLADANHYATGPAATSQEECPLGTTSPEGSDSIADCVAIPPTTADLTIIKVVTGSGAPTDWSFGIIFGLSTINLTDDDPDIFINVLDPGEVTFSEVNPAGYATAASCDNGDTSTNGALSVTLALGDDVSCTFTNTICQPGSFDTNASWACTPAAAGYFVATVGASSQTACAPGSYQSNSGASACDPASAGFYATGPAATSQTACPVGTTSPPGSDSAADCTAVASTAIYMSGTTAGTTGDGLAFGGEDIIVWNGTEWSMAFDGSAAGLSPNAKFKHNINAFYMEPGGGVIMSFSQNKRVVPGITPLIDGTDLVRWDGDSFAPYFDGSDVALTKTSAERIDGLHVLPGVESPIGGGCEAYLLISTVGPGKVPNHSGGTLSFGGEDVLGFCATNTGAQTTGLWHMVLDGSQQGMPKNSTDSISLSADGNTLYLTTRGGFHADNAHGGHSMVYAYNRTAQTFSGPIFIAPNNGLAVKPDGLQYDVTP